MKLQYLLLNESRSGIITTKDGIFGKIREIDLYFICSNNIMLGDNSYAVFTPEKGKSIKVAVIGGECRVPEVLLTKSQNISLCVMDISGNVVRNKFNCQPIPILLEEDTYRDWFEISPNGNAYHERVSQMEISINNLLEEVTILNTYKEKVDTLIETVISLNDEIEEIKNKGALL